MLDLNNLPEKFSVAVVCHDAGGANQLLHELKRLNLSPAPRVMAEGPARDICQKVFPDSIRVSNLPDLLEGANCLVSSTSWESDLEFEARKIAKSKKIKSITALDHWSNYAERFIRNEEEILPDEIWVFDKYALFEARNIFPNIPIRTLPNEYFKAQLANIKPISSLQNPEILYLSEPLSKRKNFSENAEFYALDIFLSKIKKINAPDNTRIRLRLHPSEDIRKYSDWIKLNSKYPIVIDESASLGDALSHAAWVCGCSSTALVLAEHAGRKVFCSIQRSNQECKIPFTRLVYLTDY